MSNKRKRTPNSENKTKKIDSYFKPVQAEVPALKPPTYKKVKLKTRTLRKQHLANSDDSDHGNQDNAVVSNKKKRTEQEREEKEEEGEKGEKGEKDESKIVKQDKEQEAKQEAKHEEQEKEGATNEQADKADNSSQIKTTQTQELDTQNVPIFSTQTQTQTDTMIGSPITYTFTEDDEEDDCFFDLPKLIDSQIETKKEQQQQQQDKEEQGLLFSSTQESSLDDFDDIFNDQPVVNVVSLEEDSVEFSQTDDIKISSNLPDTNLSFPSATL